MKCRNCGLEIEANIHQYRRDGSYFVHAPKCPVEPLNDANCARCGQRILDGDDATDAGMHVRCPNITNLGRFN